MSRPAGTPNVGPYPITEAVRTQRINAATKHGAQSERKIRGQARLRKRALMRKLGVRSADLGVVETVLIDVLARYAAKAELLDQWFDQVGLVKENGEPQAALSLYFQALSGIRLTADKLDETLRRRGERSEGALADYIDAHYSNGNGAADD